METIRFLSEDMTINALISNITSNIIRLEFANKLPARSILVSGFEILNENNHNNMSDNYYHRYTTIYKTISDNIVLLSNNGTVFESKNDLTDTNLDHTEQLNEVDRIRYNKIHELSELCEAYINRGVSVEINGVDEHFSYNDKDQINIKELFDLTYYTNCSVHYHADGGNCKSYTSEQFISIYVAEVSNKMHHRTYFNQLKMYIDSLDDIESIKNIEYGVELSGEYLNTYNNIMEQERRNLESFLAKRSAIHVLMGGT